jgi:MPBQ/MSBQ methyltransferase
MWMEVKISFNEISVSEEKKSIFRPLQIFWRVLVGSLAGFIFIPVALFGYFTNIFRKDKNHSSTYQEKLNKYQITVLILIGLCC